MALAPANVQSTQLTGIALDDLGASFSGSGFGMRKKTMLNETPVSVEMNSGNPWQDCSRIEIPLEGLQNDFATLATLNGWAEAGCQAYARTANGLFLAFTGADLDSETAVGLEWEYKWNLNDDLTTNAKIMTTLSKAVMSSLHSSVNPVGVTFTSGEDGTLRLRPGVKKVTVGGAHFGELKECTGSIKSISQMGRLGRPLSIGAGSNMDVIGTQMTETELDDLYNMIDGNDTIICEFWNTQTIKWTGLFGGKLAEVNLGFDGTRKLSIKSDFPDSAATIKINDSAGVLELIYLDNAAEA